MKIVIETHSECHLANINLANGWEIKQYDMCGNRLTIHFKAGSTAITPNTYGTILFNFRYLPYVFEIKEILADGDSNGIVRRCEIIK
ncbi:MAG: hypothetical protein WC358_08015 [Ignavibacteria bacterium]|jgi:hypothetical protein